MWLFNGCNCSRSSYKNRGLTGQQLLPSHTVVAICILFFAQLSSSLPLQQEISPYDDFHFGDETWSEQNLAQQKVAPSFKNLAELDLAQSYKEKDAEHLSRGYATKLRPYSLFSARNIFSGLNPILEEEDPQRPKRAGGETRFKARIPVRRNGREIVVTQTGPILDPVDAGSGANSLQDLAQIRRAIRAWEAKLMWFAEKFADHPEALKTHPVWNKLMRIRNSLLQLAQAEEIRQSGLDETRM